MWEKIGAAAAVITLLVYVFIEWPRIRQRWQEAQSSQDAFLILVAVLIEVMAIPFVALTLIVRGPIMLASASAMLSLFGLSFLLMYWVETKTFAYRRSSDMRPIWPYVVAMFIIGIVGILFYWLGLL